jgi:hypothetical protein
MSSGEYDHKRLILKPEDMEGMSEAERIANLERIDNRIYDLENIIGDMSAGKRSLKPVWLILSLLLYTSVVLMLLIELATVDPVLRAATGICIALLGWVVGVICGRVFW